MKRLLLKKPKILTALLFILILGGMDLIIGTFIIPIALSENESPKSDGALKTFNKNISYGYTFQPNLDIPKTFGTIKYRLRTNSLGFKDSLVRDVPLVATNYRVLVIGDSFIEGVGFEFNDTMVGWLNAWSPATEFLNAGVQSYSPIIYLKKIRHLIENEGLKIDEIIVFLDISDILDEFNRVAPSDKPDQNKKSVSPLVITKQFMRDHSLIVSFIYELKDFLVWRIDDTAALRLRPYKGLWTVDSDLMDQYARAGLELARQNLSELGSFLAVRKIPMTLAVYPWPHQILKKDKDSIQVKVWRAWTQENGVNFVNLFEPFFADSDGPKVVRKYFIQGDVHWNAAGHKFVVRSFFRKWVSRYRQ